MRFRVFAPGERAGAILRAQGVFVAAQVVFVGSRCFRRAFPRAVLAVPKLPFLAAFLSAPAMQFCLQEGRFSAKIGEILRLHRQVLVKLCTEVTVAFLVFCWFLCFFWGSRPENAWLALIETRPAPWGKRKFRKVAA